MPAPSFQSFKVAAQETSSSTKFDNFVQAVEDEFEDIDPDQISGYPSDGAKVLAGDGTWKTITGGGTFRAIDLRNPQSAANAGNCFPNVSALTDWEAWRWEFVKDVDGKLYGLTRIPESVTPSSPQLLLEIAANATSGVTRLSVATKAVADLESLNPSALTSETAQDITVPGTARLKKLVTFNLTETLAAGDTLLVEVFHEGAHANDTLAVNTELYGAYLKAA